MHQKDKNRQRRLQEFKPLEATREERAMKYHLQVQKQWEKQGKHLGKIAGRDPTTLSMFCDDQFRHANEERELISQVVYALANKDMGVWSPLARIGDIYAQPDKPKMDVMELIRDPESSEKDRVVGQRPTSFFESKYYKKRVKQLRTYLDKVKPYNPDFDGLIVVGKPIEMDQFQKVPQVEDIEPEIIKQSGRNAKEEEDEHESIVKVSLNCNRLFFTTKPGATQAKSIDVTNEGTAAVYYKWSIANDIELTFGERGNRAPVKKQPAPNMPDVPDIFDWRSSDSFVVPKDITPKTRSEFCFTQISGSILPGNTTTFSFSFKSDVPGCFLQRWNLYITPAESPYSAFTINLRGCCQLAPPDLTSFKKSIDNSLHESERNRCLEEIMSSIFERVSKVVKLRSQYGEERIDGDVLVDDRAPTFEEANKEWGLKYSPGLFAGLSAIAEDIWDALDVQGFDRFWDMNIHSLSAMVMKIQDGQIKRDLLLRLNEVFRRHSTTTTSGSLTYSLAYVQISTLLEDLPNHFGKRAAELGAQLPPFVVPRVPDPSELEENQESSRRRHRGKRERRPAAKKTSGRGKGKGTEDASRASSPTEPRGEISPELKLQLKQIIIDELKNRIQTFEKLSGESVGVTKQLTRVNEMDQLDTNLDAEVEDDL